MKVINPIHRKMLARIKSRGRGWVFSASEFLDLGSRDAVDKALSRMAAGGPIRRVVRGLYYVPRPHPIIGTTVAAADMVAKAIASKDASKLLRSGAYAANLLGLSDQVPAKTIFHTDGRSRRIRLGKLEIVFKHTSSRYMATAGRVSGWIIQALRYLGRTHVTDNTVQRLRRRLSDKDKRKLLKDVVYAPAWIANIMRQLAKPDERMTQVENGPVRQ